MLILMYHCLPSSYSDLCTPLGELSRLAQLHSSPWETKAEGLKKIRSDYESMKRKLNIALKKMEMMSVEVSTTGQWGQTENRGGANFLMEDSLQGWAGSGGWGWGWGVGQGGGSLGPL